MLLSPKSNNASLLQELSENEMIGYFQDLRNLRKRYGQILEDDRMSILIQNGTKAGQTVSHIHTHLIPFKNLRGQRGLKRKDHREYRRSIDDMAQEAADLKHKLGMSE